MASMGRFRMIIVCLALLLEGMSTSGINVQLGALRTELSLSDGELQLVASAFLIAYAGLLPIAGALADRLDRRRVFLAGIALFGVGCVVCAGAPSSGLLIAGRVIQGAGAALSAPAALALITAGLPTGAARNRAVAIYGAMGAVGFSLGLVIPGAAVEWFGWRWSFLISVPAVILVFVATYGIRSVSSRAKGSPDVVGAVLLTAALMLTVHFVGAITTLPLIVLATEAGVILVLAVWLIRRRGVRDIPRSVVATPRVQAACLALGGLFAGVVGSMYALSLGLSDGQGASALTVALLIVPQPILFSLSAGVGARLVTAWGAPRVFALGAAVFVISLLWLGAAHDAPVWAGILPAMAGVGVSLGLCFPAASVGAVDATPPRHAGNDGGTAHHGAKHRRCARNRHADRPQRHSHGSIRVERRSGDDLVGGVRSHWTPGRGHHAAARPIALGRRRRHRPERNDAMSLHIATDLDGTISFDGRRPHPLIRTALTKLSTRGDVALSVATARSPRVLDEWFGHLAGSLGRVCCNGAIVATPTAELHRRSLDPLLVRELVLRLRERGERFCVEYGDRFASSHPEALPWMGTKARIPLAQASPLLDGVVKVSIATGAGWTAELTRFVGTIGQVYPHATGDADVVARGANKADGIRRLRLERESLLALGNDVNDRELLLSADRAIIVGDLMPELDAYPHVTRVGASPHAITAALRRGIRMPHVSTPLAVAV